MIYRLILVALWAVFILDIARGADGLQELLKKPEGYYGVGHEEHHEHYSKLPENKAGTHCCEDGDCRPTQARWNPNPEVLIVGGKEHPHPNGHWEALVDGEWTAITDWKVLDQAYLQKHGTDRWDNQAHVCTGKHYTTSDGITFPGYVYCFLPPDSGQ